MALLLLLSEYLGSSPGGPEMIMYYLDAIHCGKKKNEVAKGFLCERQLVPCRQASLDRVDLLSFSIFFGKERQIRTAEPLPMHKKWQTPLSTAKCV